MPVSRSRKPSKPATRKIRRSPGPGAPTLQDTTDLVVSILTTAPPEQLVELLMPHLLTNISAGQPANRCVDASLTLRYAFGQFAIPSELLAVSLITEEPSGVRREHGSSQPTWSPDGKTFHGHSVLFLTQSQRFVDATADQFAEVRRHGLGPVIGRTVAGTEALAAGQVLPAGSSIVVQRGDLLLRYTTTAAEDTPLLAGHPWVARHADRHRQAGVNLASLTLQALRAPWAIERALQAPYPRLRALLTAIGDTPYEPDPQKNLVFQFPGGPLRLDEVPLPAGVPAALG
ncbi:hypothetical protein [Kitasatospora sp. NPDC058190]|uniref:hypothetical protein n=1 Tax=Kitasatospora sp. NPDC058190 TaxID=3346371 RepID=UPI0036DD90EB